jgi:hypothetical protein
MGEGARVIRQQATNGVKPPAAIEQEIRGLRAELDHLIDELDRRRHEMLDLKLQMRRHAVPVSLAAAGLGLAVAARVAYGIWRRRQRRSFTVRAGLVRDAVSRMIENPERVAVQPASPRFLNSIGSAVAAVIARELVDLVRRRMEARAQDGRWPWRSTAGPGVR